MKESLNYIEVRLTTSKCLYIHTHADTEILYHIA
jgi:hypothetical protein